MRKLWRVIFIVLICEVILAFTTNGEDINPWGTFDWEFDGETLLVTGAGDMPTEPAPWLTEIDCKQVKKVIISKGIKSVSHITGMSNLTIAELPEGLEKIGDGAFRGSFSPEGNVKMVLPDSVVYIGRDAFSQSFLKELYIPENVVTILPFGQCFALDYIEVSEENPCYCSVDGVLFSKNMTTLVRYAGVMREEYIIPQGVKIIGEEAFCRNAPEKIIIPEGVVSIEDGAFKESGLITLSIPKSLKDIGDSVFDGALQVGFEITSVMEVYYNGTCAEYESLKLTGHNSYYASSKGFSSFQDTVIHYGEIALKYNDCYVNADTVPYIKNNRTLVPMRAIFEALGAEVSWDDTTKTAIGVKGDTEVKITIGENVLYKNGETVALDCAAEITNDRTMVPVRAISEAFGCTVEWNDETKTVEIAN